MTTPPASDAARLEAALGERGLADPRPALRARLRELRDTDAAAFEHAKSRFESVVRNTGSEGDVLEPWIEYGRFLGDLSGPGRLHRIDASGRSSPYAAPVEPGALVLYLPDEVGTPALAVLMPVAPSAAQQATYDLLVGRKLALA